MKVEKIRGFLAVLEDDSSFVDLDTLTTPSAIPAPDVNPGSFGYALHFEKLWVDSPGGITILGKGGPIMNNASFPESRGLPLQDGAPRQYAAGHVRFERRDVTNEDGSGLIQGGQYFNHTYLDDFFEFSAPIIIGEGNALMVRSNEDGMEMNCSFLWKEVAK